MARKYFVRVDNWQKQVDLAVDSLIQATGLASQNLLKGRSVTVTPAPEGTKPNFKTTAAAQAHIEVELFQLA